MKSREYLEKTIKIISGDRHKDYGDKTINHQNIADLWSTFLAGEQRIAILIWQDTRPLQEKYRIQLDGKMMRMKEQEEGEKQRSILNH